MMPLPEAARPAFTRLRNHLVARGLWAPHYKFFAALVARLSTAYATKAAQGVRPAALECHRQACRAELVKMLYLDARHENLALLTPDGYDDLLLRLCEPLPAEMEA